MVLLLNMDKSEEAGCCWNDDEDVVINEDEESLDNILDILDFTIESSLEEEDHDGECFGDWDASKSSCLGPIPSDLLMGAPIVLPKIPPRPQQPVAKLKINGTSDVQQEPNAFQMQSPISVLESSSSGSHSTEKSLLTKSLTATPVRTRSKRVRPSSEPWFLRSPFLSSSKETNKEKRKCSHCEVTMTPRWREGPMGRKTLCNACGIQFQSGCLLPDYRPAQSPTFDPSRHSNFRKKLTQEQCVLRTPSFASKETNNNGRKCKRKRRKKKLAQPSLTMKKATSQKVKKILKESDSALVDVIIELQTPTFVQSRCSNSRSQILESESVLVDVMVELQHPTFASKETTIDGREYNERKKKLAQPSLTMKKARSRKAKRILKESDSALVDVIVELQYPTRVPSHLSKSHKVKEKPWVLRSPSFASKYTNDGGKSNEGRGKLSRPSVTMKKDASEKAKNIFEGSDCVIMEQKSAAFTKKCSNRVVTKTPDTSQKANFVLEEADCVIVEMGSASATKKCSHCEVTKAAQWREGHMSLGTLCNSCGVRYWSGHIVPEYRPAARPSSVPSHLSNSHEKFASDKINDGGKPKEKRKKLSRSSLTVEKGISKKARNILEESDWVVVELQNTSVTKNCSHNEVTKTPDKSQKTKNVLEEPDCVIVELESASGTKKCSHREVTKTPKWRESPTDTSIPSRHSSSHKNVASKKTKDGCKSKESSKKLSQPSLTIEKDKSRKAKNIRAVELQKASTTNKCSHCGVTETPQWREGPMGRNSLCNACGVRYRSGGLLPEYRPAASPTFVPSLHSNSHKKVIEMLNKGKQKASEVEEVTTPPRMMSRDVPFIPLSMIHMFDSML